MWQWLSLGVNLVINYLTPWKLSNCDWHIFTKRTRENWVFLFLQKPNFFYLLLRATMPALQSSAVSSSRRSPAHFCTMSHNNWSKSEGRKRKSAICDACPDSGETWGGRVTLKNTLKEKETELSNRLCTTIWNTDMKITTGGGCPCIIVGSLPQDIWHRCYCVCFCMFRLVEMVLNQ